MKIEIRLCIPFLVGGLALTLLFSCENKEIDTNSEGSGIKLERKIDESDTIAGVRKASAISKISQEDIFLYSNFTAALSELLKDFNVQKNRPNPEYLFKLERSINNNPGIDFFIKQYFNSSLTLSSTEVVTDVSGLYQSISTVDVVNASGEQKAIHRIYDQKGTQVGQIILDAIGFETNESVTLCSGKQVVVDSQFDLGVRGTVILAEVGGNASKHSLGSTYTGIAVTCIKESPYIIAESGYNTTTILGLRGNDLVPVLEIENFRASQSIATWEEGRFIILSDVNSGYVVLIDFAGKNYKTLQAVGECSVYAMENGIVVIGTQKRKSSVSLINKDGNEDFKGIFDGVAMGFPGELNFEELSLLLFDDKSKSINLIQLGEERASKTYAFEKLNKFDPLIFIWGDETIDLKTAYGF